MSCFEVFLEKHPLYSRVYERLSSTSRLMATSAQLVYELHEDSLGPVADDILSFVEQNYPDNYVEQYIARVNKLAQLQARFDATPSAATLGDASVVDSQAYGLALLLSIVLTNHRFEVMEALFQFLRALPDNGSPHRIASLGSGTGYELRLAAEVLHDWDIESYDIDADMRTQSKQLLTFFKVSKVVEFEAEFPLAEPTPQVRKRYDAILLCEVLEHLQNPLPSLRTLAECLKDDGKMFVTMAINIAQEDHVFLYADPESCRSQIRESGLRVVREWLSPQSIRFLPSNREAGFTKGNYIAVVERDACQPLAPMEPTLDKSERSQSRLEFRD